MTGLTKDALRYYEKIEILTDVPRDQNNYRQYSIDNLHQLQLIQGFRKLGLDLSLLTDSINLTNDEQKLETLRACQKAVHDEMDRLTRIDTILAQQISRIPK
ncbi:MerR family transcriptional regulator [Lactiplantibacillus herbarum]|uniref:MerR family transcriptional regulator n=1 Tax=Lactiplantibacillus herbarum TaxID=1670446 RepID=UPI0009E58440